MVVKISTRNRLVLSEDIFKQCTKFSISRIASMKSHRYSPLKLVVPTGPTASLLFTPLLMLFPNVRPESVLCSRVGTVPVQPVSHGSHRAIFSNWPLPTPLPQGGLQAPHNDGCPPHPAWLSPRSDNLFLRQCTSQCRELCHLYLQCSDLKHIQGCAECQMSKWITMPSMKCGQPLFSSC